MDLNVLILGQSTKMADIMSIFSNNIYIVLDNSFYGNRHFKELEKYFSLKSTTNISTLKGVWGRFKEIYKWCKLYNISVIYSQTKYDMLAAKLASIFIRKKIVLLGTSHNSYAWMNEKNVKKMAWLIRATTDYYIALATFVYDKLKQNGVEENKLLLIPNTIEHSNWTVKTDYSTTRTFKMAYVAYVYPGKQQHFIAEILHKINSNYDIVVDCYGDNDIEEYSNQINDLILKYNLQGKLNLKGRIENERLKKILCSYDAYICPSNLEMSPVNILEAQAAGLPIIANNTGGIPDLISDGIDGVLYRFNDVDDAIRKIIFLIENFEERKNIGENGHKRVSKDFTSIRAGKIIEKKILDYFY